MAAITALIYPLREIAPAVSTGVLYLLAVLVVSIFWGLWLGLATSLASAAAFNFFHIPPTGQFTIADGENWVALATFFVAAVIASSLAELARARAGRGEAARARGRSEALDAPARGQRRARRARGRGDRGAGAAPQRRAEDGAAALGLPRPAHPADGDRRGRRGARLAPLSDDDRAALADAITVEGRRLSRLVENLIDLSRLEAGAAEPRRDWCSIEEIARAAAEQALRPRRLPALDRPRRCR